MSKKKHSPAGIVYARISVENDEWLTQEMSIKNEFLANIINECISAAREGRTYRMVPRVSKTLERLLKQKENRLNANRLRK